MIHPETQVRNVSAVIGNGVFATCHIPRGTIVVVRDECDTCFSPEDFQSLPTIIRESIETYVYHDCAGNLVLSWDHARFMNHSCCCNTMLTDYGLEIAIKDILPGEQVTTEYGLLNIQEPYKIHCGCDCCRGELRLDDIDVFGDKWDRQIKKSMLQINKVQQPLWGILPDHIQGRLKKLTEYPESYSSVKNLKWRCHIK